MEASIQAQRYMRMLETILSAGTTIKPRGLECKEVEDLQLEIDPDLPFMSFRARKYDIGYFKAEMIWKLGANKYDTSIQKHATLWSKIINPDGTYNSNYGQYWFGEQHGIWDVITELIRDPYSRKAVIPMLNVSHMSPQTVDTVCTECVGFRLRPKGDDLVLNMSVHMRSSDVIYGLGTDIPAFAFLYRLVYGLLQPCLSHPIRIEHNSIQITAMSSHLYAKHYAMAEQIIEEGEDSYDMWTMPHCNSTQAMRIISSRGRKEILETAGELGRWLAE